jgi:LmbE family N-acetylglucosaminyl deacetylase
VERARVLVVVAHPDDETFGLGSVIAGAVDRGAEVVVCCATRGEAGESMVAPPAGMSLGDLREAELREAGRILGVSRHVVLGFGDSGMEGEAPAGSLAGVPEVEVVAAVRDVVDEVRPSVVVTLDPVTSDGHRDHDRIGAATLAAVAGRPEVVAYVWCVPRPVLEQWFAHLASVRPDAAHLADPPKEMGRPLEEVTTILDGRAYADVRARAVAAHASQLPPFAGMPDELHDAFVGTDHLVRMQPPWPGGEPERSLPLG